MYLGTICQFFASYFQTLLKTSNLGGSTPVRQVQLALDGQITEYKTGLQEVDRWLTDLEACIEELRVDALNRRCRVSVSEVETYALHLSRLSRRLASYKGMCFRLAKCWRCGRLCMESLSFSSLLRPYPWTAKRFIDFDSGTRSRNQTARWVGYPL